MMIASMLFTLPATSESVLESLVRRGKSAPSTIRHASKYGNTMHHVPIMLFSFYVKRV